MNDAKKSIVINNVPIAWNEEGKGYTFFGIDAITFWTTPSLVSILKPLREEIGDELYSLLIAYEASKGTFEDYHSMIGTLGDGNFAQGFLDWGKAVSAAGWGSFSVSSIDFESKEAVIQIDDAWEMKIFISEHPQDMVPFLNGKISGIFSHAFKTNCRSEVVCFNLNPNRVVLKVSPSDESLEDALLKIQERRKLSDNAQLRAMNSAMRHNQQRLQDILTTIGERIWETDKHLKLTHLSDFTTNNMNVTKEFGLQRSILDFIHKDDQQLFLKSCEDLIKGSVPVAQIKIRGLNLDGEFFWTNLKFKSLTDISGQHNGFLGSARDIHEETLLSKVLNEQREKSVTAAKMASLGEMAAGIAHEINNPLTEIIANAWHLKNLHSKNELPPDVLLNHLTIIENTGKRIAAIIKGMRAISRDADGDPFKDTTISTIIQDTMVICKNRFASHGIEIKGNYQDFDAKIECRPTQISQVLLNLLNNALDAISDQEEKWIEFQMETNGNFVHLHVTDSGRGIPKHVLDKLMQPFFTTKGPGKGTGIGLSISRRIVESHGGLLFYNDSVPNTRFSVLLPLKHS